MTVSVIMPTFNRVAYLAEAINSILSQTYKDLELIVVDDGSTDSTPTLMEYFTKKDKRVRYLKLPKNMGISYARNFGVEHSKGEYIAVMDSDDLSNPDRLKKQLKSIKGYDFSYSSYYLANEHAIIQAIHYPQKNVTMDDIRINGAWPHVTIMARRECFEKTPYRDYRVNDDAFLVWDWFRAGYRGNWVKEPLVIVRTHPGNVSKERAEEIKKTQEVLDKEYDASSRNN